MKEHLRNLRKIKKMGISGFKIKDSNGNEEKNAGHFLNPITFFLYALGFENLFALRFAPQKKEKVDFVSGGFIAFRKDLFDKLHGYDEDYFMYVEDMDICYRAKKIGFTTYFLPYATLFHKGQGSSNRKFAIINIYKGLQLFFEKHTGELYVWYIKSLLAFKASIIIFTGTIFGWSEIVDIYKEALKTIK